MNELPYPPYRANQFIWDALHKVEADLHAVPQLWKWESIKASWNLFQIYSKLCRIYKYLHEKHKRYSELEIF